MSTMPSVPTAEMAPPIHAQVVGEIVSQAIAEVEPGSELGLVSPLRDLQTHEPLALTPQLSRLPVELDVSVPVRGFRVRNLLTLKPQELIESSWGHAEDVPLAARAVVLTWCEFEVIGTLLAVRVTRLA